MASVSAKYKLYTYFRSSCSARVRIAAYFKGINLDYHFIHLLKKEQASTEYIHLNPSAAVPTLCVTTAEGQEIVITQSVAILEFLEESQPQSPSLLPPVSDPHGRARVRELMNIIACDIQPVTNLRMLNQAEALGLAKTEWAHRFMIPGLAAYEQLVSSSGGKYSVGDNVTLADVCLGPAIDSALRFGIEIEQFPTVARIYASLQELVAFQKGGWRSQQDTPEDLRC